MAKIEKRQAVADLGAIIEAADGIMVARGDLGVETDLARIALLQKSIIASANKVGCPVITATQMLESMIEQERPTRAEVTDVTNAMLDGTDGVMLSAETAVGRFPVAAVQMLQRVLVAAETEQASRNAAGQPQPIGPDLSHDQLSFVACQLALGLRAKAIVAPVSDIETALAVARFRPSCPILTITKCEQLCRSLAVVWGVSPMLVPTTAESPTWSALARQWLVSRRLAEAGDALVTLSLSESGSGKPDSLQVVRM
jgi:pyruvate kinase